jgi:hypothetical protein
LRFFIAYKKSYDEDDERRSVCILIFLEGEIKMKDYYNILKFAVKS